MNYLYSELPEVIYNPNDLQSDSPNNTLNILVDNTNRKISADVVKVPGTLTIKDLNTEKEYTFDGSNNLIVDIPKFQDSISIDPDNVTLEDLQNNFFPPDTRIGAPYFKISTAYGDIKRILVPNPLTTNNLLRINSSKIYSYENLFNIKDLKSGDVYLAYQHQNNGYCVLYEYDGITFNPIGSLKKGVVYVITESGLLAIATSNVTIQTLNGSFNYLNSKLEDNIVQVQGSINLLNQDIKSVITDLDNKVNSNNSQLINSISELNSSINSDIENVNLTINSISENINNNYEELNSKILSEDLKLKEDIINLLDSQVVSIESNIQNLKSTIEENVEKNLKLLETKISQNIEPELTAIKNSKLDALSFDGSYNAINNKVATQQTINSAFNTLQIQIDSINNSNDGILSKAKLYADVEIAKLKSNIDTTDIDSISELLAKINELLFEINDLKGNYTYTPLLLSLFTINSKSSSPIYYEKGTTQNINIKFKTDREAVKKLLNNVQLDILPNSNYEYVLNNYEQITLNKSYLLVVGDNKGSDTTKTIAVSFIDAIYYGASSSDISDLNTLKILNKSITPTLSTINVTANSGQYIYYAVPKSHGECKFKVGGFDGGFTLYSTADNYYIYKSENHSLGLTEINISKK